MASAQAPEYPRAALAATIFAIHPVQVESVAWATERENVLSLVFYLLSFHAYLNFTGEDFNKEFRKLAPGFSPLSFSSAHCSANPSPAPCPPRFCFWFIGGMVGCAAHIGPWFPISWPAASWPTLPVRWKSSASARPAANGPELLRSLPHRRPRMWSAAKLLWPHPLAFVYPKWTAMSLAARPAMILFPLSATAAIAALFLLRHRITRGPLVAVLFFAGTHLPALGFVNLFPMRYTPSSPTTINTPPPSA